MAKFTSNVLMLVFGGILAQIVGLFLLPIITRLYPPEFFGVYQIFLSLSSVIMVIAPLAYQFTILLPKTDEDSAAIVMLCLILVVIVTIISSIIFFIFTKQLADLFNIADLPRYIIYLPFLIFLSSIFNVITFWETRRVRFGVIATSRFSNSISGKVIQIGSGVISPSPLGLIAGLIGGYFTALVILLRGFWYDISLFKSRSFADIRRNAIRYIKFPLFTSWSTIANEFSLQVSPFMLAIFFNTTVVGYYALANQVINLPIGLIGSATQQVFFQKVSDVKNKTGVIKDVVHMVHQRLISLGIAPIFVFFIISENLFVVVFGNNWLNAGIYAKILIPWIFFIFLSYPLTGIFAVLERQEIHLTFNVLILFSRIGVLYVGGIMGDPVLALILYSATGILFYGWMNFYILKISGLHYMDSINIFLKYLIIIGVVSIPLIIIKILQFPVLIIIFTSVISVLVYYLILIKEDPLLMQEIKQLITKKFSKSQ